MAARAVKIRHDESTRAKIKAGNIIHRLNMLIAGEIEMPPHAVTAAVALLRKVLPDLSATELSGEIITSKVIRSPAPSKDPLQWQNAYVPQEYKSDVTDRSHPN